MRKTYLGLVILVVFGLCFGTRIFTISADAADPWEGDITINSDGSVSPSDAPIKVSGKNYKLTSDINGGIEIEMSGINLNGGGYTLMGDYSGCGILAEGLVDSYNDISLMNLKIINFEYGIFLYNVDGAKVMNNEISDIISSGILLYFVENSQIMKNDISYIDSNGIFLYEDCDDNKVMNNFIGNCGTGILIWRGSDDNMVMNNEIKYVSIGIGCSRSNGNKIIENDISYITKYGKGVYIVYAMDNIVKNNVIDTGWDSIWMLDGSSNNEIMGNELSNAFYGINMVDYGNQMKFNIIKDNEIRNMNHYGIAAWGMYPHYCITISANKIWNVLFGGGIDIYCEYSTIKDNEIKDTTNGWGLGLLGEKNLVRNNKLEGGYWGLSLYWANDNLIINNVFKEYEFAFWFEAAYDNILYHNDIMDNTYPFDTFAWEEPTTSETFNTWDNGNGEGNYWSDYEGSDTDDDGIGDTDLPHAGVDYYPLMKPYNK